MPVREFNSHNENVQATITTEILNMEQLRDITMSDEALMRDILNALVDDTSNQLQLLAAAIESHDAQLCTRLAHYSKGACANVGANRAAALLRTMELNAAAGAFGLCGEGLHALKGELELLRHCL